MGPPLELARLEKELIEILPLSKVTKLSHGLKYKGGQQRASLST